jgi:hypothetical protein
MTVKIKLRRDTYTNWYNNNPTLSLGEPSYDVTNNKLKIGDGLSNWRTLSYLTDAIGNTGGSGTVTSVGGTGTVAGLTLTGTVTTSGSLTLGGTLAVPIGNITATGTASSTTYLRGDGSWATVTSGTTLPSQTGNSGKYLTTDGSALSWGTPAGGSGLSSRTTAAATTSSLTDFTANPGTATGNASITGFKGYGLYKIQTSAAAWVVIYDSTASRTSDASRDQNTDPLPGSGIIAEVITSGAQTIKISPGTVGFSDESPVTTAIPIKVTNLSGGTTTITVTLTLVCLEV